MELRALQLVTHGSIKTEMDSLTITRMPLDPILPILLPFQQRSIKVDSDGDGVSDGKEYDLGSDPLLGESDKK